MRRAAALLAILALLALPAVALAQENFSAELTGAAERPDPVDTDATGSASVMISDDESSIDFEVSWDGLSGPATMAHIHLGGPEDAGPPILWLSDCCAPGSFDGPLSGTLTEADLQAVEGAQTFAEALQAIRDGNTYVNVHTEANPGGEIRGQLTAVATPPLPPTSTTVPTEAPPSGLPPTMLLLALAGLAALWVGLRRFDAVRA